ncbi:uncharacterized protein LOC116181886 [Photinus pyralis]|uniref:uncharacterized protein LOC116181886 n=1 Tax=Photinus pyralis TaxID=7054 RepID=UPI0012675639|nr:uncharacterized protein LOC116181886 [Photinus pyralis]
MYYLVKFVEDGVYYICNKRQVRNTKKKGLLSVRWADGWFYDAKIKLENETEEVLLQLCKDLNLNVSPVPKQLTLDRHLCVNLQKLTDTDFEFERIPPPHIGNKYDTDDDLEILSPPPEDHATEDEFEMISSPRIGNSYRTEHDLEIVSPPSKDTATEDEFEMISSPRIDNSYRTEHDLEIVSPPSKDTATEDEFEMISSPRIGNSYRTEHAFKKSDSFIGNPSTIRSVIATGSVVNFHRRRVILPQPPQSLYETPPPLYDVGIAGSRSSRKYFCVYCKKISSNLPQHFKSCHSDEVAVQQFLALPPGSKHRKKIIETIRRQGDYEHNKSQENNSGRYLVARRNATSSISSKLVTTCPECKGQFLKKNLRRHYKRCAETIKPGDRSTMTKSRALDRQIHSAACHNLTTRIFPVLRDDDCVKVIQFDSLAITIANRLCRLYPDPHFDDMIRAKLRLMGRLLLQAKALDSTVKDFSSLITPIRYELVIVTINKVSGLNESGTVYRAPSTATMANTLFKVATDIWRVECIKSKNTAAKIDAEDFLLLMKMDNASVINKIAIENRVQDQRHKVVKLPDKSDVKMLVAHVRRIRREMYSLLKNYKGNSFPYETWHSLASSTLISLLVFNRRRPGELERLTLSDYHSRSKIDNTSNLSLLDQQDRQAAETYSRFEIRGKLNRSVPVLVHWELELCLNLILKYRSDAGIHVDNPYLFGLPQVDHRHRYLRAYVIMRIYASQSGAKQPHLLRATVLRKQIATECAVMDLSENTIKDVAMFMGHAEDIHNKIYRLPVQTRDIVRMSRVLEAVQGDTGTDSEDENDSVGVNECDDLDHIFMNDVPASKGEEMNVKKVVKTVKANNRKENKGRAKMMN